MARRKGRGRKVSAGTKAKRTVKAARQKLCRLAKAGREDEADAKVFYNEFKSLAKRFAPKQAEVIEKIQSEEEKHHQALKVVGKGLCK